MCRDVPFAVKDDDIDHVLLVRQAPDLLLQQDIVVGHQGIGADRCQIPRDRHAAFAHLRFDGLAFTVLDDDHHHRRQQDH